MGFEAQLPCRALQGLLPSAITIRPPTCTLLAANKGIGSTPSLAVQPPPAADATADARWMREQLRRQAVALGLRGAEAARRLRRLHFATLPVAQLEGALPSVLSEWAAPRKLLRAHTTPAPSPAPAPAPAVGLLPLAAAGATARHAEPAEPAAAVESTRLDAFYGYIPWPLTGVTGELQWAGWDCEWGADPAAPGGAAGTAGGAGLNGSVALIRLSRLPKPKKDPSRGVDGSSSSSTDGSNSGGGRSGGAGQHVQEPVPLPTHVEGELQQGQLQRHKCSYRTMLRRAEAAGAMAVVVATPKGEEVEEITCRGGEEEEGPCPEGDVGIPATMVPYRTGRQLRRLLRAGPVRVEFPEAQVGRGFGWVGG